MIITEKLRKKLDALETDNSFVQSIKNEIIKDVEEKSLLTELKYGTVSYLHVFGIIKDMNISTLYELIEYEQ